MPRYYFNIREKLQVFTDLAGQEFPDQDAAERAAETIAAELRNGGCSSDISIELFNEHGRLITTVKCIRELH